MIGILASLSAITEYQRLGAIIKYHRFGGLNNKHLFLESGEFKIKELVDSVCLVRALVLVCRQLPSCCVLT